MNNSRLYYILPVVEKMFNSYGVVLGLEDFFPINIEPLPGFFQISFIYQYDPEGIQHL